jgi:hypothetical protein
MKKSLRKSRKISESDRPFFAVMLAVLMIASGAIAVYMGLRPISEMAMITWRANSLVEVPATINDVQRVHKQYGRRLKNSYDAVVVRYSYQWQGVPYQGSRIQPQKWETTNDLWHTQWFQTLEIARQSGAPVPAWVRRDDPAVATLDKEPTWSEGLLLAFVLLIVFSVPTLYFAWLIWRVLAGKESAQ